MDRFAPLFAYLLLLVSWVAGFPGGPDPGACDDMMPQHGFAAQSSPSPYTIRASQDSFCPGDIVEVIIGGEQFMGFMLQARAKSNDTHLGSFEPLENTKPVDCLPNKPVGHSTRLAQKTITLKWNSVGVDQDVQFFATVVQQRDIFWVKINGPELSLIII